MDEGSSYCGCGSEIESVSDAARITNMIATGAGEEWNLFEERQCGVKYETKIFADRLGIMGWVEGRERKVLTILEVCRGIPIRRNSVLEELRVR